MASASSALANPLPLGTLGPTACQLTDITFNSSGHAMACEGWYGGNLDGGNPTMNADSATDLNLLLGTSFTAATLPDLQDLSSLSGTTIHFSQTLTGITVFAVHVGAADGAGGVGYEGTAFYEFNAGAGISSNTIALNVPGLSNARLYETGGAVPEPASWALMILGFGGVGAVMRSRRRSQVTAATA